MMIVLIIYSEEFFANIFAFASIKPVNLPAIINPKLPYDANKE